MYTDALTCTNANELTRMSWLQADENEADVGSIAFLVQDGEQEVWYVASKTHNAPNIKPVDEPNCTRWELINEKNLQSMEFRIVGANGNDTGGFGSLELPAWSSSPTSVVGLPNLPLLAFGFSWGDSRKRLGASSVDEVCLFAEDNAICSTEPGCVNDAPPPPMCTCHFSVDQNDPVCIGPPFYEVNGEVKSTCPVGSELCVAGMDVSGLQPGDVFSCDASSRPGEDVKFQVTERTDKTMGFFAIGNSSLITNVQVEGQGNAPFTDQLQRYVLVGTSDEDPSIVLTNGTLGASPDVLSSVNPDLADLFLNHLAPKWVDADPDYLCGAALLDEGTTWAGDVALTASKGRIDVAGGEDKIFGSVGVIGQNVKLGGINEEAEFFEYKIDGASDSLRGTGVVRDATMEMLTLRSELYALEAFFTSLETEVTLKFSGLENEYEELCIDCYDENNDGFVVIDIDSGMSDFKLIKSHWIIESEQKKFAVIRIVGDNGFVASQSGIMVGDGVCGNVADSCVSPPQAKPFGIRAAIVRAKKYTGLGGLKVRGVKDQREMFKLEDVVLNGVGFYDLVSYQDGSKKNPDRGQTLTNVQNSQGCSQFVGSVLQLTNYNHWKCTTGLGYFYDGGGCSAAVSAPANEDISEISVCVGECCL